MIESHVIEFALGVLVLLVLMCAAFYAGYDQGRESERRDHDDK